MWVIARVLKRKDPKRARKYAIYVLDFCRDAEITFVHARKSYYLVIIRPKMVVISK